MSPARPKFHEAPTEPRIPRLEPARAKSRATAVTAAPPKKALTEEEEAERRRLLSAPTPAEGTRRSGVRRRSRAPVAREEQVVTRGKDPRREE